MTTYHIRTDADSGTVEAVNLNAAIRRYFGRCSEIRDLDTLEKYLARLDGGWCSIERDGEVIVEIGIDR